MAAVPAAAVHPCGAATPEWAGPGVTRGDNGRFGAETWGFEFSFLGGLDEKEIHQIIGPVPLVLTPAVDAGDNTEGCITTKGSRVQVSKPGFQSIAKQASC